MLDLHCYVWDECWAIDGCKVLWVCLVCLCCLGREFVRDEKTVNWVYFSSRDRVSNLRVAYILNDHSHFSSPCVSVWRSLCIHLETNQSDSSTFCDCVFTKCHHHFHHSILTSELFPSNKTKCIFFLPNKFPNIVAWNYPFCPCV